MRKRTKRLSFKSKGLLIGAVALIVAVGGYILLNPVINRVRDNGDVAKVNAAVLEFRSYLMARADKNGGRYTSYNEARRAVELQQDLQAINNPHTESPYELIPLTQEYFTQEPGGKRFINYDSIDEGYIAYGLGSCDAPVLEAGAEPNERAFLVYHTEMTRTGETSGSCVNMD